MPPTTIFTAIVSPNALPKPSKTAEKTLGAEARKTTFLTVSHLVAPTDNEASFNSRGIELNDSTHNEIIMGNTITDKVNDAVKIQSPVLCTPNHGAITSFTRGTRNKKAHNP